ncbi:MAG: AbrB/MazE/SpoVT family DNA-binding domain-containing protein [Alphaproteobacteria bacterium]
MALRIARWGNSLAVRLPKTLALDAGLEDGDAGEVGLSNAEAVAIRPAQNRSSLDELVAAITPGNRHGETDWRKPQSRETW